MTWEIVVPARDEADWLPTTLAEFARWGAPQITVVDNGSTDATADVAHNAGARVLTVPAVGKGFAARAGIAACVAERVFLCDADISGLRAGMLEELEALAVRTEAPVVRLAIGRSAGSAPVTTLTARPLLAALGMTDLREPLGGLVLVDRAFVLQQHLPGGWGFDVALTLAAHGHAGAVPELGVNGVEHRPKPLEQYRTMAEEVALTILRSRSLAAWSHGDCVLCQAPVAATTLADVAAAARA